MGGLEGRVGRWRLSADLYVLYVSLQAGGRGRGCARYLPLENAVVVTPVVAGGGCGLRKKDEQ